MYHLELRQFPHVARRFNQSEQQVLALAKPWVGEEWIEEAERKWNMHEATLTILEGPKLSMADLAMGRGWRNAQRRSEDVTERVLAAFRAAAGGGAGGSGVRRAGGDRGVTSVDSGAAGAFDPAPFADSLALELLALLDSEPLTPARVWRLAHERLPDRPPADALALADRAVRSLLERQLVVLLEREPGAVELSARSPAVDGAGDALDGAQVETALSSVDAWAESRQLQVVIARKR